jgi:hypothetical protein
LKTLAVSVVVTVVVGMVATDSASAARITAFKKKAAHSKLDIIRGNFTRAIQSNPRYSTGTTAPSTTSTTSLITTTLPPITTTSTTSAPATTTTTTTPPPVCDLHATTGTFSVQIAAATSGQVVCLAAGNYGTWLGTNKSITVKASAGAAVTMAIDFRSGDANFTLDGVTITSGLISGNSSDYFAASNPRDITVRNSTFTGAINIEYITNSNIVLDGNTHNNIDNDMTCTGAPARIWFSYGSTTPSGVTIKNSKLDGGNTDGIQAGTGFTALNNEFSNIRERDAFDCAHTDTIQLIGATGAVLRGNYIHHTVNGIVAYDGVDSAIIENNVIDLVNGRFGIELYTDSGSIIRHNTLKYGTGCSYLTCGWILLDRKLADPVGTGTIIEDNIASGISMSNGSTAAVNRSNMLYSGATGQNFNGVPTYTGGANPSTFLGFKLASSSAGHNAALNGLDIGI